MPHIFFFSYARENLDKELKAFFEDLCTEVAPYTPWVPEDSRISFRDGRDLPLMEQWEPAIMEAIQTSAVLVCVTSLAYFQKHFCGQEYWVFDQRRRQNLPDRTPVPTVVLPVIWAPVEAGLPPFMDAVQWRAGEMPDIYSKKGLRYLKKLDPNLYERCVTTFAEAIKDAWHKYPRLPPLGGIGQFAQIPNAFAGGKWDEAAGPTGWLPGPGVANFVFAAAQASELRIPAGRYGTTAAEWRPFLPPVARTIADIARAAAKKHSLRYREMFVSAQLLQDLRDARERKNLMLVLADARSLQLQQYHDVNVFDGEIWEGAALLIPWSDDPAAWDATAFPAVKDLFPIKSQLQRPAFLAPISKAEDFDQLLDITLAELRGALTKVETEKKEKMDDAPAQIVGSGETSS